jgi:type I restriction enzyme M protein
MTNKQLKNLKDRLWESADQLRANSGLKSTEYATPILGFIFLRFAQSKYSKFESAITAEYEKKNATRAKRPIREIVVAQCGYYLPPEAKFNYRLNLPELVNLAEKTKITMENKLELFNSLTNKKNELFIVGWQNDLQPRERVKNEINEILDRTLPDSYDPEIFEQKRIVVFDHIVDQAIMGYTWVA